MQKRFGAVSLLTIIPAGAYLLLVIRPQLAAEAALAGLETCLHSVVPSLFPFLVLTRLLMRTDMPAFLLRFPGALFERVFHIRRTALPAFLLGLVGGCPVGAEAAAEAARRGDCSPEEAGRLLVFADNCSIGFLFGVLCTQTLHSTKDALILLLLQWGISVWLGWVMGIGKLPSPMPPGSSRKEKLPIVQLFTSSILEGGRSALLVCAYVVFFSAIGAFLPAFPFLRGLLEMTGGILALEGGDPLLPAAFLLGWGGAAVGFQVLTAAADTGIPTGAYFPLRLLHAGFMLFSAWSIRQGGFFLLLPPAAGAAIAICVKKSRKPSQHKV